MKDAKDKRLKIKMLRNDMEKTEDVRNENKGLIVPT